ncbi:MAG: DUF2007 domain-containing protein [Cyclonatronaceae bacterium]
MFNEKIKPDEVENWECVYETSIESEAGLVQAFLKDQGLECEVLSKKDSAYTVNFGDLSALFVYVPAEQADDARKALSEWKDGKIDYEGKGRSEEEDENGA